MTPRAPIFASLDALILAESPKPESWRGIPNEVREQDLERVRDEELGDPKDLIRRVEEDNQRGNRKLVDQLLANARERRSAMRYAELRTRRPRRKELCPRKPRASHWAELLLAYVRRDHEAGRREVAA
jgi:hypothetical protein